MAGGTAERETFIFLQINDEETFDLWTSYQISADVMEAAPRFSFSGPALSGKVSQRELELKGLKPMQTVEIFVKTPGSSKPSLQCTGRIDSVEIDDSDPDHGAMVAVSGRCHLAPIVDSDMLPGIALENITLGDLIKRVLTNPRPGFDTGFFTPSQIKIDNDANRALLTGKVAAGTTLSKDAPKALETYKVDQARQHPGETIFQFLMRHITRFGLLMWGTADGKVVIGRPNYKQKPLYRLASRTFAAGVENTARFKRKRSSEHRPSEIHVYGRHHGGNPFASPIHAVVYDEEVHNFGHYRAITISDNNARTKAEAEARAKLELSQRMRTGDVIHAITDGYTASDGALYAIDTMVDVDWDNGDVHEDRYIVGRTFARSEQGTFATLEIIPRNTITLGGAT